MRKRPSPTKCRKESNDGGDQETREPEHAQSEQHSCSFDDFVRLTSLYTSCTVNKTRYVNNALITLLKITAVIIMLNTDTNDDPKTAYVTNIGK